MAGPRPEPFQLALTALRDRLRLGVYQPGARIAATDLADELRLSATPVREALSRLAGEGVLEDRRGQGFFVHRHSAADIADLYRLSLAHLLIAQDPHRPHPPHRRSLEPERSEFGDAAADPVGDVEKLFVAWVAEGSTRALLMGFRRVHILLGPIRRLEPRLLTDLEAEAAQLAVLGDDDRPGRLQRLRQFHGRRMRLADRISTLIDEGAGSQL